MNQCDGCRAHIPIIHGMHRMAGPDSTYPDYMMCQAVRYTQPFADDEYYELPEDTRYEDWQFDDSGNLVYIGGEPPDEGP